MMNLTLPEPIQNLIAGRPGRVDDVGCSSSTIVVYDDMVLKIEPPSEAADRAITMMRWLAGKVPAPVVLADEVADSMRFLLMSRVPGVMSCDPAWMERPDALLDRLAEGLRMLWAVGTAGCPCVCDLEHELTDLRRRVERGEVNIDTCTPGTFGPGSFRDPADLLDWLERNRPVEELVVSHGDYCLPNVMLSETGVVGFIDLGACGLADRWRDISLCLKSLRRNFGGFFGGPVRPAPDEARFFDALGIERNEERLRYYLLLDELFN